VQLHQKVVDLGRGHLRSQDIGRIHHESLRHRVHQEICQPNLQDFLCQQTDRQDHQKENERHRLEGGQSQQFDRFRQIYDHRCPRRGHLKGLCQHLPNEQRPHQKGQDAQEAQTRLREVERPLQGKHHHRG